MNDIRRTILWVIFGFSLVMLWDQWQVYNGRKATFFPSNTPAVVQAPRSGRLPPACRQRAKQRARGHQQRGGRRPDCRGSAGAGSACYGSPPRRASWWRSTTDVFKLTFDTEGGSLVKAELLKHADMADKSTQFRAVRRQQRPCLPGPVGPDCRRGWPGAADPQDGHDAGPGRAHPARRAARPWSCVLSRPRWAASSSSRPTP